MSRNARNGEFGNFDEISPKSDWARDKGTDEAAILTNPANLARMAILTNFAVERLSSRWGYRRSGDFDESGEFGENGDFDEIRRRAIELKMGYRWSGDFDESGEFGENGDFDEISPKIDWAQDRGTDKAAILTNPANSARMSILTNFAKEQLSSRWGYRRSGDFDKSGEFGENGDFDEFRRRAIELEIGVPTKQRFWRIRQIRREWRFWRNFAEDRLSLR